MLRLLLAGVLGAGTTMLVVSQGTFVYSPFQYQLPFRSAVKVTPDPANIWSWHGRIFAQSPVREAVPVDLDGNGRSDTENPHWRVVVTDVQVEGSGARVYLSDASTRRWLVHPVTLTDQYLSTTHFSTPLVFPVGSVLTIEAESGSSAVQISVNIIGRVVTL